MLTAQAVDVGVRTRAVVISSALARRRHPHGRRPGHLDHRRPWNLTNPITEPEIIDMALLLETGGIRNHARSVEAKSSKVT